MKLTVTQTSALVELRRRDALVPSRHAWFGNLRTFSRGTLQALVDADLATWTVVRYAPGAPAVAPGIVPVLDPGDAWFVNEEGSVYSYSRESQEADFPNDFHEVFSSYDAAVDYSDRLAQSPFTAVGTAIYDADTDTLEV